MLYWDFKPAAEDYCAGKKKIILLLINNATDFSRALMEVYNEINVSMPANTISIL